MKEYSPFLCNELCVRVGDTERVNDKRQTSFSPKKNDFNCIYSTWWLFPVIKTWFVGLSQFKYEIGHFFDSQKILNPNFRTKRKASERWRARWAIKSKGTRKGWEIFHDLTPSNIIRSSQVMIECELNELTRWPSQLMIGTQSKSGHFCSSMLSCLERIGGECFVRTCKRES